MDVWWNNNLSCKDLEFGIIKLKHPWMFRVPGWPVCLPLALSSQLAIFQHMSDLNHLTFFQFSDFWANYGKLCLRIPAWLDMSRYILWYTNIAGKPRSFAGKISSEMVDFPASYVYRSGIWWNNWPREFVAEAFVRAEFCFRFGIPSMHCSEIFFAEVPGISSIQVC